MPAASAPIPDEAVGGDRAADDRDQLLAAVVDMTSELDLDTVLRRVVLAAAELTGARYAALGVLSDGEGVRLSSFVHRGMAEQEAAAIGHLPEGHGILGVVIDQPQPLRLHDLGRHPLAYGFPPGHPPMKTFLGVPIRSRGRAFGNLYLAEKGSGDFTQRDEDVVVALANAAGVVIENARLHQQAKQREQWLEAAARITIALTRATGSDDALAMVAEQARSTAGADAAWLVTRDVDALVVRAVAGVTGVPGPAGPSVVATPAHVAEVVRSGRTVVTQDIAPTDPEDVVEPGQTSGPGIVVPLRAGDEVVGALALGWRVGRGQQLRELDPRLPESFAAQAALALQVVRSRASERRLDLLEERDRIGRDLHDVVVQRIYAVGLGLQSLRRRTHEVDTEARAAEAVRELDATVREIRRTIFDLGAPDGSTDLQTEVGRLVERAASTLKFRPRLDVRGPLRSAVDAETGGHLLAVLAETLSNCARHADASRVDVTVEVGREVTLTVADDGRGLPDDLRESGLANVRERAGRLGGRCALTSSDHGTTVTWSVPLVRSGRT